MFTKLGRWRNAFREYRPIFIAGAGGSGTTLLAYILGQRFECAGVVRESARLISSQSFLHVSPISAFNSIRDYERAILPDPSWSIEEGRSALLNFYRSNCNGSGEIVIDKGPNTNLVRADFLARCFPKSVFLLIFRDPVANVEGFRRKWTTFGKDSLAENIRFYESIHTRFLDQMSVFPERVFVLEYEELVRHHEKVLEAIGTRMRLQPSQYRQHFSDRPNIPGKGIRNVRENRIDIVQDANEEAYRRLNTEVIERIRDSLGPLHDRLRKFACEHTVL